VWIDAGAGNDEVQILSGSAILVDQAEQGARNDTSGRAFALSTTATLIGALDAPANGRLNANATFSLAVNGAAPMPVTVTFAATPTNTSRADLVSDLQAALDAALGGGSVVVKLFGNRLALETVRSGSDASLAISGANDTSASELGFASGQANSGQ